MNDDKLVPRMAMAAMAVAIGLYMLQAFYRPAVAAEEEPPYGSPFLLPVGLIINVEYGEDVEPVYIGEALPGTADDEAAWRIYCYIYETIEGDLEMVGLRYAEGSTNFDKKWTERDTYDYR